MIPMRSEPTWRIPIGILALVAVLAAYAIAIASLVAPLIADWPALGQMPVYLLLGVLWLWLLPLRRFLIWMETGRWG
jgi:membrane protein YdbS with pleckstrin-like domain